MHKIQVMITFELDDDSIDADEVIDLDTVEWLLEHASVSAIERID